VLNIGKLAPGAADYYLGEVATSAEDYYTGKGESQGRWVGSLAPSLGLEGPVASADFRAVLDGRHPRTDEQLARSRAGRERSYSGDPNQSSLFDDDVLDVARTASRLHMTVGRVRQLLWAGQRADAPLGGRYLRGWKEARQDQFRKRWQVPRQEIERFEAVHGTRKARPGYDLTLRPPKSVSVLWALAPPEQRLAIRDAHREAVDAVVDYVEAHALHARRGGKDRGRMETDGLVAAAFDHRTSRAGDPLLHTHVVAANLTRTAEGKWQAIDGRDLYDHARPAGFLYQAHLRHTLSARLGISWGEVHNGWAEVEGVPEPVVRAFSKRRDEIEEVVAESGYTSARAHQIATLSTRRAKEYGVDASTLEARWREEAQSLGFGPDELAACLDHKGAAENPDRAALFSRLAGPLGLTKHSSTFTRRSVVEAVAEHGGGGAGAERIEALVDEFLASGLAQPLTPPPEAASAEAVWRRDGSRARNPDAVRWSTPELLELEQRIVDWAGSGFGAPVPAPNQGAVETVLERRPELSQEQAAMVRSLADPGSPAIHPVAGRPGSGKTYAAAAYVEALVASGVPVVGCALSATAAAELEAATALGRLTGRPASTMARLFVELARQPLPPGAVVIVDEASMVGTRDLARLTAHVAQAGGALKLIGDPDQHGAVDTGGLFRTLAERQGDRLVALVDNNRQVDAEDRAAIDRYREGLVESALARYDAADRVVRSATAAASYDAMVADWWASASAGGEDPMMAGPNAVRAALNRRARAQMKAEGFLNGPSLWSGDREFCVGDWVVARRNDRRLRSEFGAFVKNGSAGKVVAVDEERRSLTVDFRAEGCITLPERYLAAGWADHGYARTTYGVQGATLERGLYHAGDRSSFEEGYVALTRARQETRVYLVDGTLGTDEDDGHRGHAPEPTGLDTVARAMERRRAETPAIEVDSDAATAAARYGHLDLAQLRIERGKLEAVLAAGPVDVSWSLREAQVRQDELQARRRASTAAMPPRDRADERLEVIDRQLSVLGRRLDTFRAKDEARRSFLESRAEELAALRLVRRAELGRVMRVRMEAVARPDAAALDILGPRPVDPAARQSWSNAIERAAVHRERWGMTIAGDGESDGLEELLGSAPVSLMARSSYEAAAQAIRSSIDPEPAASHLDAAG
jgi:conjugative relaxase-like TrwC/TraI family protein